MKIVVEIKNVYGNELIYPACEKAIEFTRLTGTKTLSPYHIERIKALGYTVEVQQKTL